MRIPKSINNWLSITGFAIAINSLIVIVVLFLFSLFSKQSNSYLGLFIYIITPAFFVGGLLMVPIGMLFNIRKRETEEDKKQKWPVLNFNLKKHRATLLKISVITLFILITTALGSYQAFQYTESIEFCGKLCHKVMEPEYTTYQHSSHAQVPCVQCHVGEGASWYVKSKLSGLYQVYSVIFHKYAQPIATPLHNLRPARETCERCHWPEKFYIRQLRTLRTYLTDEKNTEWNISLLMKIGPEHSALGLSEGIHWHINKNFKIEYISTVPNRESIAWVRMTNLKTGEVKIFNDEENPLSQKAVDTLEKRTMDCMDCHNRPSHLYKSAPSYIDNAMVAGAIPKDIPFIKKAAMEALKNPFTNKDTALMSISQIVSKFYKDDHAEVLKGNSGRISKSILAMQNAYSLNAFPYMRAESSKYLDHIGHLESDGCFRCHSDRHKTNKGEVISRDCNMCHSIVGQGPTGSIRSVSISDTLDFVHPVDIKGAWRKSFCSECHKSLYE